MKARKKLKLNKKKLLKKFKKSRQRYILAAALVVILLGAGGVALKPTSGNEQSASNSSASSAQTTTLHVESSIPGVAMQGSPDCDSQKLQKQTPYDCTLPAGHSETIITAPDQVSQHGKAYVFQSWDGCSESNSDKKICKIKLKAGDKKTAKATYELAKSATAGAPTPNPTPSTNPPQPGVSSLHCTPRDYANNQWATCGFTPETNVKLKINMTYAPDCKSYNWGIENKCSNQVSYYSGRVSPAIEPLCYYDPEHACDSFSDMYAENTLIPGYYILRFPTEGTITYSTDGANSSTGQAIIGTISSKFELNPIRITINVSYVPPVSN
jgi:hypothetical protein